MDNGLTKSEAAEALTRLLFYAGWLNVFSSTPVAEEVFEKRPKWQASLRMRSHRFHLAAQCIEERGPHAVTRIRR